MNITQKTQSIYLSVLWHSAGFFGCGLSTCRCGSHSGWRCSLESPGGHLSGLQLKTVQINTLSINIMVHNNHLKRSVQWKWVPPFPGKPQSSLLMTNVRSDFCLPAKLTSTPLLFPAPQVFIYRARACTRAARVRVSWVSFVRPMSARDTMPERRRARATRRSYWLPVRMLKDWFRQKSYFTV